MGSAIGDGGGGGGDKTINLKGAVNLILRYPPFKEKT